MVGLDLRHKKISKVVDEAYENLKGLIDSHGIEGEDDVQLVMHIFGIRCLSMNEAHFIHGIMKEEIAKLQPTQEATRITGLTTKVNSGE